MRWTLLAAAFAVLVPGAAAVALLAQDTASKPVVLGYGGYLINNKSMLMRWTLLAAAFAVLVPGAAAVALLAQDTASKPVVEVYKSPT